ncbi:arsenate reductase family protein [Prochlorococcus sp. MIT 1307]|uniref:arsenate reductase family protein n=1 Tax=Prochlorococcus sp. MIT 1307 TaxID=3096219 RepID=UPI002A75A7E5|nr:arsenate reductase family protein [Prochlorococcus sp. MIT 1307]
MTSKLQIYSYSSCSTCKKALKWLQENNLNYTLIDITQNPPEKEMLIKAMKDLGSRKSLFNTSGLSYRALGAKVVQSMSDSEAIKALLSDGKLIKRPFLITQEDKILIGFKPEIWAEALLV